MPRKFGGEDTRGLKAKAQKAAAADEKAAKSRAERKRAEDKEWAEGGNSRAASKAEAQAAKDAKRAADRLLKREIELKEAAELGAGGKGVLRGAAKVAARRGAAVASESAHRRKKAAPAMEASGMDAVLLLMGEAGLGGVTKGRAGPERHPERRAKAAYRAFEDREMPKLRADFPSLKRSQLKERLWKVWQKSDENPLNQETAAYNAKPASAAAASAAAAGDV
ncbi:hypothetical protein FNF31_05650 [Cafeteria roenbergensis]|uniref:Coiled-coil domain-containing protein n=1 Tax=Cafeteria roenbergensis TaxID=33653 RepID=A0A5A8CXQ7_CAFRO|nr:hypothetical protein FNF31_05650 [Cafeteria roenbergensis]